MSDNATEKRGARHVVVSRSNSTIVITARWIACATMLAGASVRAQPPMNVQWMSEIPNSDIIRTGLIDPITGNIHIVFEPPDQEEGWCSNHDAYFTVFGPNGLPIIVWLDPCLSQGSLDQYVTSAMRTYLGRVDVLNVSSVGNPNHSHIYLVGNGEIQSWNQDPPNYGYAYAYSVFADGDTLYIGGTDVDCPTLPGRVYKRGGTYWRACLPSSINSFEVTSDSVLAIHYPSVFMLNKATGAMGGSFNLFTGAPLGSGRSYLDGDSLYWTCGVDGSMHVGKYVLGQGPEWEETLPFGLPKGLELDAYGRLWTAAGNNLIWIDASDGTYDATTQGTVINTLDMRSGELLLTGRLNTDMAFILKAIPTP